MKAKGLEHDTSAMSIWAASVNHCKLASSHLHQTPASRYLDLYTGTYCGCTHKTIYIGWIQAYKYGVLMMIMTTMYVGGRSLEGTLCRILQVLSGIEHDTSKTKLETLIVQMCIIQSYMIYNIYIYMVQFAMYHHSTIWFTLIHTHTHWISMPF